MKITDILTFSGLLLGTLCGLVLILFPQSRKTPNIFLGISIMCLAHALLASWLNLSGKILEIPFLMRTGHLSVYLIFPFLYLFYKGVLKSDKDWKPWYYLLFIPSLFYFVDFFPFFFLNAEDKVRIFTSRVNNPNLLSYINEGLLGWDNFHFVFRTLWSSLFLVLIGMILWQFRSDFQGAKSVEDKWFFKKLVVLWGICIIILMIPALLHLLLDYDAYSVRVIEISLSLTLILLSLNLFFNPRLLYGDYWVFEEPAGGEAGDTDSETPAFSARTHQEEKKMLELLDSHMQEHSPYLKKGYTIHELAQATQIPAYRISHVINQVEGRNFSSWINAYRVSHFIILLNDEATSRYTVESIAKQCGFSSRSSLINSFKKEKGMTPGSYIRNQKLKLD
ncbi:helix-turn-helix domain-containing protein [Robiginitalea sp.]|uniref:helix-turn-helix domain-containing protein n=1 Tax=Robiginitalea sp. TaxID=1902411 RepID=UPI003C756E4D